MMYRLYAAIIGFSLAWSMVAPADVYVEGQLFRARLENLAADPTGYEGRVYYNTATDKIRVYANGSWENVEAGATTLQSAYDAGNTIVTAGGSDVAITGTEDFSVSNQILGSAGAVGAPSYSYTGSADTGMWLEGGSLSWSVDGTRYLNLNLNGNLEASASGTASQPTYSFLTDTDSGMYRSGSNEIGFSTNTGQRMTIGNSAVTMIPSIFTSRNDTGTQSVYVQNTLSGSGGSQGTALQHGSDNETYIWNYETTDINFGNATESVIMTVNQGGGVTIPSASTGGNVPHACIRRTGTCVSASSCNTSCTGTGEKVVGGGCSVVTGTTDSSFPNSTLINWQCNASAVTNITVYVICCPT